MNDREDIRREISWTVGYLKKTENFRMEVPVKSFIDDMMKIYDERYDFDGGNEGRMYEILSTLEAVGATWDDDCNLDPVWQLDSVIAPDQQIHYIITNTIYKFTSGKIDLEKAVYEFSMGLSRAIEAEITHKLETMLHETPEVRCDDNSG